MTVSVRFRNHLMRNDKEHGSCRKTKTDRIGQGHTAGETDPEQGPQSVSYTHLDVYKRQVKADAPGVSKEDIKVTVEGNFVTIEYELKKEENREENGKTVRNERYYGMQSRSFALAQEVDERCV